MKRIAGIVVKIFALGIPMVIAACYGMPARYSRSGKVIDQDTHDPLQDIRVSCIDKSGSSTDNTVSSSEGSWHLYYDEPCDHLDAEDTQNPARYQKATVPFPTADGLTISLKKIQ